MCHSLTGRQSPRRQGGDLLALRMTRVEMLEFVREMPVRRTGVSRRRDRGPSPT